MLGNQEKSVAVLEEKVKTLQRNRDLYDRPDIDSLKTSRIYVIWVGTFVGFGLGLIGYFRRFFWKAALPWLREELRGNRHPPTADALDLTKL